MNLHRSIVFGTHTLDLRDERLWRDGQPVELTPKAFSLLRALVENAGQLATKDELFRVVWPRSVVTDATLTQCIRELRQALRDDARTPRYIETVHGRGYRFIAPLQGPAAAALADPSPPPPVVGRDADLAQMDDWLRRARSGQRQVVLVAGEPGIGKTTLVQTFLSRSAQPDLAVALGRCIEQFGSGEAYLPVLEALERLGRTLGGTVLGAALRQYAPSWLVQLPALTDPAERDQLQRQLVGTTRERMLREIAHALEVLGGERPIVLWLEDLHWSDYSTLDLLSCLARRTEPARLMVIATYRPVDVLVRRHPLRDVRQELSLHGLCRDLVLGALGAADVEAYLRARLGEGGPLPAAARFIHGRTEGNPLFMTAVVDDLLRREALRRTDAGWAFDEDLRATQSMVPDNLRQLIERQLDRLPEDDRRILEVASVAGAQFSAEVAAAAYGVQPEAVDEACTRLARAGDFLQPAREAAGSRAPARYRFAHAFHQEVIYQRLADARRRQLHLAIGAWQAQGAGAASVAAEIAMHFDRGGDARRAVTHLRVAANNALRQSAHAEATTLIGRGLQLLAALEPSPERTEHELALRLGLGAALLAVKGFGAPEVGEAYGRARGLLEHMRHSPDLMLALGGLITFYVQRGDQPTAHEIARQCVERAHDPVCHLITEHSLGTVLYCQGRFVEARAHLERAMRLYPDVSRDEYLYYGRDPGVVSLSYLAGALWHLGYFDQAWERMQAALQLAHRIEQPISMVVALLFAASLEVFRRDVQGGTQHAERALDIAAEQRYPYFIATATILHGHFLVQRGAVRDGIEEMQRGLAARKATGGISLQPFYVTLLAEAYARLGERDSALGVLEEGLQQVAHTGERGYEAELHRLRGVVLAQASGGGSCDAHEAEASLLRARDIARAQQTRGWELRAATDLARLWQRQGRAADAQRVLHDTCAWFSEGLDNPDVREAEALLDTLRSAGSSA